MVASSANESVARANAYNRCTPGYCLKYVRTWLGINSRYASAAEAWNNADHKHRDDRTPPRGAPVFWTGGSQGYGHIALATGRQVRSTDVPSSGVVGSVPLDWFNEHWSSQTYQGWAEDLNGTLIPYLADGGEQSKWSRGDVYVRKLDQGTKDSDSVARLVYRLRNHSQIPNRHRPPRQVDGYGKEVVEAVRYWQREVRPNLPGPDDGEAMSNAQANVLFGSAYDVHEE